MKQGWEYKKLGEIGKIVTGSTPSTKDESNYSPREYCFVKPSDLPSQGIVLIEETEYYVSSKGLSKSRVLPIGSVLVSCIGSIGKIGILTKEACSNQQINAIIPKNDIDSKFIAYSIYAYRFLLESIANAPVVPIINKTDFSKIQIPLPPKSTQLAIVSELDKINELIRLKKEQLKDFDNLAQSIFYEMFGDPVKNEMEWEVKKLKDVCEELFAGGDVPKANCSKTKEGSKIYPIYTNGIVNEGLYGYTDIVRVDKPSLTISARGTIGAVFKRKANYYPAIRLITVVPQDKLLDLDYTMFALKGLCIEGAGGTIPQLTVPTLKLYNVQIPPLPLQHLFAQRIEQIEHQKAEVQKAIADLETLLASRMQYWFE